MRWNYDLPLNVYLIKSDKGFKVYQDDGATLYKYTIKEFTKASGEFKTVITTGMWEREGRGERGKVNVEGREREGRF